MKIGLNAKNLLIPNPAGPEKYTLGLYKALLKYGEKYEFVFYSPKPLDPMLTELFKGINPKVQFKVLKPFVSWTQVSMFFELLFNRVDIFFTPEHTIPFVSFLFTPVVSMIHGLEYKTNKEIREGSLRYYIYIFILNWVCRFSKYVIVPTNFVKKAIFENKYLKQNDSKIKVIYEGIDDYFFDDSVKPKYDVLKKYNIKDNFILFVSTIQPRKNIPKLIEAYSLLLKKYPDLINFDIVLSGKKGWNTDEIYASPAKFGVENNIKFLGYAPDEDVKELFNKCSAYVHFSSDEGFGLTLLEGMISKVPCGVSDIPAYKEIGQNFCLYADPKDVNDIALVLENLIITKNYPDLEKAYTHALQFSWEKTAKQTLKIMENAILIS